MTPTIVTSTRDRQWHSATVETVAHDQAGHPGLSIGDVRHQTIEGWGGCFNELGWLALQELDPDARGDVVDALFDPTEGCRFNLCRLPIGASDYATEWYSLNETPGDLDMAHFSIERDRSILIPYIRAAMERRTDLKLFASPWSPPTWMKHPRAYNYGTLTWKPDILRAYALYFARFVEAYREEGIRIDQIHPQNEPIADQKFPSCVWTGAQLRDFIRDYLAPCFRQRGIESELWLGTLNMDDYDGYVNLVLTDEAANRAIAGVGLQWYGSRMVQRIHAAWPGKRIMQTENECGDGNNRWEYAHYVFRLLQHYLANGTVAYAYWNMILQPGGRSTWGWTQNSMITIDPELRNVTYNPEFYVMKHYSRFVDPGASRLELDGCLAGNATAFANPDGTRAAVIANPLKSARATTIASRGTSYRITLPAESFVTVAGL